MVLDDQPSEEFAFRRRPYLPNGQGHGTHHVAHKLHDIGGVRVVLAIGSELPADGAMHIRLKGNTREFPNRLANSRMCSMVMHW